MRFIIFIVITSSVLGCYCDTPYEILSRCVEEVTSNLYKMYYKTLGNSVFSGFAVAEFLSVLSPAAIGETKTEILNAISWNETDLFRFKVFSSIITDFYNSNSNNQTIIDVISRLFIVEEYPILELFRDINILLYKGNVVETINFQNQSSAANTINQIISQKTNGNEQNFLTETEINQESLITAINTLYFSAKWSQTFCTNFSRSGIFYESRNITKELNYMRAHLKAKYTHSYEYQAKFLELSFKENLVSMTFILPDNTEKMDSLEDAFEEILQYSGNMRTGIVDVILPKFTIVSKNDLVPVLRMLGISKLFSNEAELPGLSSKDGLKIDNVIQKMTIELHELGVGMFEVENGTASRRTFMPTPRFNFFANHPFLYYIRHKPSDVILLAGKFQG